ncbi:AAA family ATPase [Pelagibacterium montanilacus]|uniref:AAA family ATPase n=1 Tax=Pelagibacterium montanilacus TaxID=2185280 RepID=UPI000F8EE328|nr:AAA family ATPase [Pelagibacterium montanilacus]
MPRKQSSSTPERIDAASALPLAIIEHAFGKVLLGTLALGASPALALVVKVPSEPWCEPIGRWLEQFLDRVEVQTFTSGRRAAARAASDSLLSALGRGLSAIAVSAAPESTVSQDYHAAVDRYIEIDALQASVVRSVIAKVTGERAKDLKQSDLVGINIRQALAAIGAGGTATNCVSRLRRIRRRKAAPADLGTVPTLSKMPLVQPVREWVDALVEDIARLDAGRIGSGSIRFAALEGPPGTGKTMLAAALGKSVGWRFVQTSVQDWFNAGDGHLGAVTKACASFIDTLLEEDRAIGFIDELQSIPDRGRLEARGRDWWTPVVDGILIQIDRVRRSDKKVLLLGACNHYNLLDPALVRAGRLETRISVRPPSNVKEATQVVRFYLADKLSPKDIDAVANLAVGSTPAEIEALSHKAEAAARRDARNLELKDIIDILVPDAAGDPQQVLNLALHEAAHAVIAHVLGTPVHSVTIIPKGAAAGTTRVAVKSQSPTASEIEDAVVIFLAGRAADEVLGNGADAGAASDLAIASELLIDAREKWGLYGRLTASKLISGGRAEPDGPTLAVWLEQQLARLMARARQMVETNTPAVRALAHALVDRKTVHSEDVEAIITAGWHIDRGNPSPKPDRSLDPDATR